MASPSASTSALLLFSVLFLLILGAAARPCKTLFFSHAVSSHNNGGSASAFEVSQISAAGEYVPSRFFIIYRILPLRRSYSSSSAAASTEPLVTRLRLPIGIERPVLPRPVVEENLSFGSSSVRERARDILIVLAGLLFGVGCGGLASVALYLAWSLINNRDEVRGSHGYGFVDDGDEDGGVGSPKKMGYTDLPAVAVTPVSPLKEGYPGN